MDGHVRTRRHFLATSASSAAAGWLALALPGLSTLAGCARSARARGEGFRVLEAGEADALRAFADGILPAGDGFPGAEEAGAVHFIDLALAGPLAPAREGVRALARELDARAGARGQGDFASLARAERESVLAELEGSDAFEMGRAFVIFGVFADPTHGGNREGAGWHLLGMEHAPVHRPPFGSYDAEANRSGGTP